jgi:hypothetical protein
MAVKLIDFWNPWLSLKRASMFWYSEELMPKVFFSAELSSAAVVSSLSVKAS